MFAKQVKIGDKVLVMINNETKELEIIDLPRGNLSKGQISFLSPIAKALLGKSYPQIIKVKLPNGEMIDCKLMKVSHWYKRDWFFLPGS